MTKLKNTNFESGGNPKVSVNTSGWSELNAALDNLGTELKGKVLRSMHRELLKPFIPLLSAAAPNEGTFKRRSPGQPYEDIQDSIKLVSSKSNRSGMMVGVVQDAFHARFLEYGNFRTEGRPTKRKGRRGNLTARPFIEPVLDSRLPSFFDEVTRNYGDHVTNALKKKLKSTSRRLTKV